jgi:competence protein ComEA
VRGAASSPFVEGYLDLNRADSLDLVRLPGIGPVMAGRILALRRAEGPFRTLDRLQAVEGIGPKRLERLRNFLTVSDDCRLH